MYKIIVILALILVSTVTSADPWVSSTDKKYNEKDSALFTEFLKAREILDSAQRYNINFTKADEILRHVLDNDPDHAPAYREYGRLLIKLGYTNYDNFEEGSLNISESAILSSLAIEPEYAESYVLLGHLYTQMKRLDEAETALGKAEAIGTESPWLNVNWADLLSKQEKHDDAIERYLKTVDDGPTHSRTYTTALSRLSKLYRLTNRLDEANKYKLLQLNHEPSNAWAWGNYSYFLLFYYSDVDGAIYRGRKALEIMDYGMGRFTLGSALYTKWAMLKNDPDRADEAQLYFDEAWSIYPKPQRVIETAVHYDYTKITAKELKRYLFKVVEN